MSYLFLSYARASDDEYFKIFLKEFVPLLREQLGLGSDDEAVFRDADHIDLGEDWRQELNEAISTCKVFVPLYTPFFFTRDYCGREWGAFRSRLTPKGGKLPPLIRPLLWIPPRDPIPQVAGEVQYGHGDFGGDYARRGLQYLIRLEKRAEYRELLTSFVEKLVAAVAAHPLPPTDPPLRIAEIPSAFLPPPAEAAAAGGEAPSGPGAVEFVIVAGRRDELKAVRKRLEPYGGEPLEWRPYLPEVRRAIGLELQKIAVAEELLATCESLPADFIDRVRIALKRNRMVVVVVDVWSVRLAEYAAIMRTLDESSFLNCAILVAWNRSDEETVGAERALGQELRQLFENRFVTGDPMFHGRVDGPAELETRLRTVMQEVRRRIVEHAEVQRVSKGEGPNVAPQVSGPGGRR